MSELRIDTTAQFDRPWLLDQARLLELDAIVDDHIHTVHAQVEAKARQRAPYREDAREIVLDIGGGHKLVGESFAALARLPEALHSTPRLFELKVDINGVRATMQIRSLFNNMSLQVLPGDDAPSRELFVVLHNWATGAQAPTWQRWWRKIAGFHWGVFIGVIILWMQVIASPSNPAKSGQVRAAHELLARGLTPADQARALELILALSSDYGAPPAVVTRWSLFVVVTSFLVAMAMSYCPKAIIGIGNGVRFIERWRLWMQIAAVLIPGAIVTEVLRPNAADLLAAWAGGK